MPTAKHIAIGVIAACWIAGPAAAATFSYSAVVTESIDVTGATDRPNYDLPDVGTTGTIEITVGGPVFDGATAIPGEFVDLAGFLAASASFGSISAALVPGSAAFLPLADGSVRFANGSFSGLDVMNTPGSADSTLAGSFSVSSASFPDPATTLSDVLDRLAAADASVRFGFNGTVNGAFDFVSFNALSVAAPIPLPAGGVLLLAALGAFGAVCRRMRSA